MRSVHECVNYGLCALLSNGARDSGLIIIWQSVCYYYKIFESIFNSFQYKYEQQHFTLIPSDCELLSLMAKLRYSLVNVDQIVSMLKWKAFIFNVFGHCDSPNTPKLKKCSGLSEIFRLACIFINRQCYTKDFCLSFRPESHNTKLEMMQVI